ncbi:hypothetical protein M9979_09815 [Sphingomonas sp. RP10(2022)]|uniref:Peptidase M12 n=1 Tax=Sphingomonas liriopis TaxID=2949094 RepID=A0A9X2HTH7_9SPHN|nr:hypothetical protein [Sphingomonas liriopis]MCP3735164.1 hypothetical protein [Sphingomonas liriopis]
MSEPADAPPIACTPKRVKPELFVAAAQNATAINPHNHPGLDPHVVTEGGGPPSRAQIAVLTSKYWGPRGVDLTVGFLDQTSRSFRDTVLRHMNAWANDPRPGVAQANIRFRETGGTADVRIATQPGDGHWSYIGTDIRMIHDTTQPTMNLDGFSAATSEAEFCRVVRHETGHTIGCPHEHMRAELIAQIDVPAAIAFYAENQGWSEDQTRAQVLTPLEAGSLLGTDRPDARSIMCYQIPGTLTKDHQPILGGTDIDVSDYDFIARTYPRPVLLAATAPLAAAAAARRERKEACPDCIVVELPGDIDVRIPPDATQAHIRHVLKALD